MNFVQLEQAFGVVVRELRSARGLSQERLASEAGLHRTYVSFLERGMRMPTLATIFALSKPLDIQPHELIRLVSQKFTG